MDSEHRHELKTNELADLLAHFPQFLKRNASTIIGITLIVIALITWPLFTRMSRQKTIAEEARVSRSIQMLGQDIGTAVTAYRDNPDQLNPALNTILANAEALMDLAMETDNPNLTAMAYIKAAQAIRTELHLRKDTVSAETVQTQTQKAQQAYEKAVQAAEVPAMKAMAQFGIGLSAEERGQMQQAAEIYRGIIDDEAFEPTVFPTMAQERLDNLQENTASFTFAPAPVEEPAAPEDDMIIDMGQLPEPISEEGPPVEIEAPSDVEIQPDDAADQTPEEPATNETATPAPDTETGESNSEE